MAAVSDENADTQQEDNSNININENQDEPQAKDESKANDESKAKDESKTKDVDVPPQENTDNAKNADDDKNIHVPKDKKLKIEYVSVKETLIHNDAVFYDIQIKTSQHYWHVTKRYSQFEILHNQLAQISKDKLPLLPGKHYKWFTDHTKSSFIEKRRALLDNYVKKLIKTKNVSSSQCVVNFFHNDKSAESVVIEPPSDDKSDDKNDDNNDDKNEKKPSSSVDKKASVDIDNDEGKNENDKESVNIAHRESDEYDFPQDQEVTNIVIQSTRKMTDHVLYQICVSNSHKRGSFREWTVLKRFTQFYDMDLKLRASIEIQSPELLPTLPVAPSRKFKFVHDHMDDDFIEERRVLLQNYLAKLLRVAQAARNEDFLQFLGVDM